MSFWKKLGKGAKKFFKNPLSPITEPIEWVGDVAKDSYETLSGEKARDAARKAQDKEMQNWYLQQEYNTPANQVARLRAAGLNPNLFYEQGNAGNATSAPGVVEVPEKGDISSMLNFAFQALPFMFQAQQINNQAKAQAAQIQHQQDVLDFQRHRFAVEQTFREENNRHWQLDFDERVRHNKAMESMPRGGLLGLGERMFTGFFGRTPTDVASDTGNVIKRASQDLDNGVYSVPDSELGGFLSSMLYYFTQGLLGYGRAQRYR